MQSFGPPRATTNPYIRMLDASLVDVPGLEHVQFDRRTALFGRYDVIHLHWPETLLGGSSRAKRTLRRLYATSLIVRLALSRQTAVVRTVHNVDLPQDITWWERVLLEQVERLTDFRILLNDTTYTAGGGSVAVIPHGHYREWFAHVDPVAAVPDTLGFVGLVRQYKGVERLIEVFRQGSASSPQARLLIAGNPTSAETSAAVKTLAASDDRIVLDLRYLSEEEFAQAVMSVQGVVLPYRFMHNSGTALAVLSLSRPVLVPANEVNLALAREVGDGWVHTYEGELNSQDLTRFHAASRLGRDGSPDLSRRGWERTGESHLAAYRAALSHVRGSR